MMIKRSLKASNSHSFFIFGARGTGKSTFLHQHFSPEKTLWIDLLNLDEEARLQARPMSLAKQLSQVPLNSPIKWVVIDEVQKLPQLLDVVHREIERGRFLFALSSSSARKLKRGAANLLAGRAFSYALFPFTAQELGPQFDLNQVFLWGSLPQIFGMNETSDKADYLRTYVNTYLKEEIQAEQIVRKMAPFRAFLDVAAQSNGKILNYSQIARAISSDPVSVQSYFEILGK